MDEAIRKEITNEIVALSSHYPLRKLSPAERARWLDDYVTDLGRYDGRDVRLACAVWRQTDTKKMPTPGELLAICQKVIPAKGVSVVLPPPKRTAPVYSEEHKAEMRRKIAGLVGELTARHKNYNRLLGETETEYARRLWPSREVRRP